jgi:hypothetical protein
MALDRQNNLHIGNQPEILDICSLMQKSNLRFYQIDTVQQKSVFVKEDDFMVCISNQLWDVM